MDVIGSYNIIHTTTTMTTSNNIAFEITIQQPAKVETFAALFQNIKALTECVNVQFDTEKMYIQTMDAAHISILEIMLPKAWFCEYKMMGPNAATASYNIGISVAVISKILNARDKTQSIRMEYDQEADKMYFHMFSKEEAGVVGSFDRHFEAPLMELEYEPMGIPEIEYQIEFSLPSMIFYTIIHQLRGFGDNLDMECNESKICLTATTQESGRMSVDIRIDDLVEFAIEEGCEMHSSYALQYLTSMVAYGKFAKHTTIKMHSDYPLRIDYMLDDLGEVKYYLAPKIGDETS